MAVPTHGHAGQIHNLKTGNNSLGKWGTSNASEQT
jgi:hypothetical protein